jgi:PAS domain S-box-containing protein
MAKLEGSTFGRLRGLLGSKGGDAERASEPPASSQELRQALLLLRDYEQLGIGWFWASDADGRITYVSECVAQTIGRPREEILGKPIQSLFILERDAENAVERPLQLILSARKTFSELEVRAASEETEIWWSISGRPQFTASGDFTGYRGNGADITSQRQSNRDASRLAEYDSLTSLANRHRMGKRLGTTLTAYKSTGRALRRDDDRPRPFQAGQRHAGPPRG